jgi:hypothetical protein
MNTSLLDTAMNFLSEEIFKTVACDATKPKGYRRPKSDYFSFKDVQQQETSSRESLFLKKEKSGETSQSIGKAHDAITSWVGKHVTSHQKETGQSSLFLGSDLADFLSNREKEVVANTKFSCRSLASSQGDDDDTVLTVFCADDSETASAFLDDDFWLLSDDSELSIPFSALRQSRIQQRLAPLLPGEHIRLRPYEQYQDAYKSPSVWVIRVFQPDEKGQGFRFELHPEGDDFAMTLYDTDILDNILVLVEMEAGGTEELIFQIRMGVSDESLEVAGDSIIDHLGVILGMDRDSLQSPETIDGTQEWNERAHQLWERGEQRSPLLCSASCNNGEPPFVRWTMSQESRKAELMS